MQITGNNGETRKSRRLAFKLEAKAFQSGEWGKWKRHEIPNGVPGSSGWAKDVRWAYANNLYVVLCRPLRDLDRFPIHCAIRTASQLEPPWRDKQRIKDELFGEECVALEIMPKKSKIVDEADMYHIWVMNEPAPFSL